MKIVSDNLWVKFKKPYSILHVLEYNKMMVTIYFISQVNKSNNTQRFKTLIVRTKSQSHNAFLEVRKKINLMEHLYVSNKSIYR